jgi:hypothetical protein
MMELRREYEIFAGKREGKRILGYIGIWKLIAEEQAEEMSGLNSLTAVAVACSCELSGSS